MKANEIIVIMFAATICMIILIGVISPLFTGVPLSEQGRHIIEKIAMAIIAIISYEFGSKQKKK